MAESTEPKVLNAKKQVKLEDIKFNPANKTTAIVSCIPIVGLIMMFVEKEDNFVRYMGAQYTILGVLPLIFMILYIIPVVNVIAACVSMVAWIAIVVAIIMGMVKASKGERFDIPVVTGWAVSLINAI